MHLFFVIQILLELIFYADDQEFEANLDYIFYDFSFSVIKVNHFLYCFIIFLYLTPSFLRILSLLVPYVYVFIESIDCILLSLSALNPILLTFSVNTLCFFHLNLCCNFNVILLSASILLFSK